MRRRGLTRPGCAGANWSFSSARERLEADAFYADLMGVPLRRRAPWEGESEPPPVALPAGFRIGAWLDVGGRSLADNGTAHVDALRAMGISDACIMVNDFSTSSFGFGVVSPERVTVFAGLLRGSGINLTLTSWLRPSRPFIDAMLRDLPPLAQTVGATAIELDVEERWTRASPAGFATHDEAAEYLFAGLRRAAVREAAVNCQVDQIGGPRMRAIVQLADVVIPQAYSTPGHAIGSPYGPRGLQRRAAQHVASAAPGKPIIMGLAAWRLESWPGHSPREIMTIDLQETIRLAGENAIRGARYWSWKHLVGIDARGGRPAKSYGRPFLEQIARSRVAGQPAVVAQPPVVAGPPAIAQPLVQPPAAAAPIRAEDLPWAQSR